MWGAELAWSNGLHPQHGEAEKVKAQGGGQQESCGLVHGAGYGKPKSAAGGGERGRRRAARRRREPQSHSRSLPVVLGTREGSTLAHALTTRVGRPFGSSSSFTHRIHRGLPVPGCIRKPFA